MKWIVTVSLVAMSAASHAGFGGMGNVESEDGGSFGGPALIAMLAGAAIGYFVERAYNKYQRDKMGQDPSTYSSDYLGGKLGAIIGAIALPVIIGLLR